MVCHIGAQIYRSVGDRRFNTLEYMADTGGGRTQASLSQALQFSRTRPSGGAIESESHAVFGHVDGSGDQIVDRGEAGFAQNIVIDDSEILQVRVPIAQRA